MKFFLTSLLLFFANCSIVFYRSIAVNSENFDYSKVAQAHFGYNNEKPVPLTVRRGNNVFGRTTKDGRYLFFAGEDGGTFNILFRDLKTAVIVPVTKHPSNDTKPTVHPSGKKIAFVTERFDSEGDIAIMDVNPEEWLEKYLQGERLALTERLIVPTNPQYSNPEKIQRFTDTDPTWSPDGRYILFATDRFSRGKTNLALIDTKENFKITQITTEGGASPTFAPNGKEIFYISYKHHKHGEIYKLNLETKEETRITNDEFIDLSPSVSEDGKYLIYTSIRKDTNENQQLGLRDNSYIVRIDLRSGKQIVLTDGSLSIFDTNYSSFNNGSIIFTASLYNSLNVYFIPIEGEIPKQKDIQSHYDFVKLYTERSIAFHEVAFNSLEWFHGDDPLYPLIYTRSLRQLAKEYQSEGNSKKASEIYQNMLSYKNHPKFGFAYALAFYELNKSKKKDLTPELWNYYESMKNLSDVHPQIPPAILYWIGRIYFEQKQYNKTLEVYEKLLKEYPNFYEIDDVKYYYGNLLYEKDTTKVPKPYLELLKQNQENGEVIHKIFEDIHSDFLEIKDPKKRIEYLQTLLNSQKEIHEIPKLKAPFHYSIAEALSELDEFDKSNQILQEIKKQVPFGSYMYLKASLLLVNNFESLNEILASEEEMYEFVSAYSPFSGFQFSARELEEALVNLETQAKILQGRAEYEKAIKVYYNINEILNKAIERKLPISSILNKYKNYYHKKLIELAFAYSEKLRQEKESSLFSKLNVVKQTDPLGNLMEGLAIFFRGSWFRIFGDFRDLQILTPIEKEGIESLENYYKENIGKAKSILDLGFLYGYAYFLIRKATQEEMYYLKENALTEARKKAILRELRSAELELLWCIYAKPDFIDAYLLLGWLYQYIDIRKETIVFPEFAKDRDVFRSFYLKTFPRKYLEENVDIYTHALEVTHKSIDSKSELSIHLNLANNYFLLNNFQKALFHYETVEKLSEKILEHTLFETYTQEALFYFNYARALIYNGKVASAVPYLLRVKELYYEKEYFPLVSKISSEQKKLFEEKFEDSKQKLALIHALLGLLYLELENFNDAILSLATAISFNSEREYINNISLYNTIAICYQKIGEYPQSEKYINLANREYTKRVSLWDAFDFSIWNVVYTDEIRVIGEGRFVGEFPLEFSNLLTQSIQIQNRLQLKEFENAKTLIQARKNFIHKKSLEKYVMGQKLLDLSLDDLGYTEFSRGNFAKAEEYYEANYKNLEKAKKDKQAFASFYRGSISLFSSIEQDSLKISTLKERLNENLKFLNKIYQTEMNLCLSSLVENSENYLYCKKIFYKNYTDYDPVLAYTYFYLGESSLVTEDYESAFEYYGKALNLFQTPMEIPISEIGLENDPFTKKERTRFALAQAIIYFRMGDLENYTKAIQDGYNLAVEFEFEKEFILIQLIRAEVEFLLARKDRDFTRVLEKIETIETKLKNSIGLLYELEENVLNYIYTLKSYCYVHLKNKEALRQTRESIFSIIFFRQLLTNEFRFQNVEMFRNLNKLQFLVSEDREYALKIEFALEKEQDPKEILKAKDKNYKKILDSIAELKKRFPKGSDAFSWMRSPKFKKPELSSEELIVEIYNSQTELFIITNFQNKEETFNIDYNKENLAKLLSETLQKSIQKYSSVKRIVFIPSIYLYNISFQNLAFYNKTLGESFELRFLFRFSQLERERETGFSRLRRVTTIDTREERKKALLEDILINPIELLIPPAFVEEEKLKELNLRLVRSENLVPYLTDTDVLEGPADFTNRKQLIGENKPGYISLKQIVENEWNIPVLVLNNYSKSMENFLKIGFLYDILHFAGIQSIILLEANQKDSERIRNFVISNISSANEIIQKEKLMLVGEPLNPYPKNTSVDKEFDKFTKIGLHYERLGYKNKTQFLNSMKSFLQANSVLSSNEKNLQITSEINIARVKTKLLPNPENPLQYFYELLQKFKVGDWQEAKILFHTLLTCYFEGLTSACETLYDKFLKNQHVTSEQKNLVNLFRNLNLGNLNDIASQEIKKDTELDKFILNLEIALLFEKNLEFDIALEYLKKTESLAQSQEEEQVVNYFKTEIEFEKFFVEGVDTGALLEQENIYSLGKSKEWKKYKAKLETELEYEREHFKRNYLERIYSAFEKIRTSSYFHPASLSPVFLKGGETSLKLISSRDRSFLFYLLLLSSFYNPKVEVSPQINLLIEAEKTLGNKNRYLWMTLKWAEILYFHGYFDDSKNYFNLFEKNISELYKHLEDDYLLLKYQLSLVFPEIKISNKEREKVQKFAPDVYERYEKVLKTSNVVQIPSIVQNIISNYKKFNKKVDFYEEKKISNFLNFCMHIAKEKNSPEVLFDLGMFKEKWKAHNERIFGRDLFSSEIPNFNFGLVKSIQARIPKERFLALFELGRQTYLIDIQANQISMKEAFSNNEFLKQKILNYVVKIQNGGSFYSEAKEIELEYRQIFNFKQKQLTYLYFPSYHFKAPFEFSELENVYYVTNLEVMLQRKSLSSKQPSYKLIFYKENDAPKWWQSLKNLEGLETRQTLKNLEGLETRQTLKNLGSSPFHLSQEILSFFEGKYLTLSGKKLHELNLQTRTGEFAITGNLLKDSSLKNDDMFHSLYFLSKVYHGFGLVEILNAKDTHTAYFLKGFLAEKSENQNFQERFYEGYSQTKLELKEDKFFVGWKPVTNVFLSE